MPGIRHSLLIYDTIPEKTQAYLIPNKDFTFELRKLLEQCHGHLLNCMGCSPEVEEALETLSYMLIPEETYKLHGEMLFPSTFPVERRCFLSKYEAVKFSSFPLESEHITHVYYSGYIL